MAYLTPEAPTGEHVCRRLVVPLELLSQVNGAILELTKPWNWEQLPGQMDVDDTLQLVWAMWAEYANSVEVSMIGTILPYVSAEAPGGTLDCDGSTYTRAAYPALYDAIDPVYHIDANSFRVPDLRGLFTRGENGDGVDTTGGAASVSLTVAELPAHTHTLLTEGVAAGYIGEVPAFVPTDNVPSVTGSTGSGNAHENLPPYRVVKHCIVAHQPTCLPEAEPVTEFVSDWLPITTYNETIQVNHGLGAHPSRVELWWCSNNAGTGTRHKISVVGSNASGVNVARGPLYVTETLISIRTGNNTSSYAGVNTQGALTGGYYQVRAWP